MPFNIIETKIGVIIGIKILLVMFLKIYSRAISLEYLPNTICCKFDIFLVGVLVFRISHKYAISIDCIHLTDSIAVNIVTRIVM